MLTPSRYGLGSRFDAIVDRSPSLKAGLEELRQGGYSIKIGSSTFIDRNQKIVSIATTDLYKVSNLAQSLSHELGHLGNEQRYIDYRSRDAYVASQLRDEGVAVSHNLLVRQELIDAGVGDIGVLGSGAFAREATQEWHAYKNGQITSTELVRRLGDAYGREHPQLQAGSPYIEYYGASFGKEIERHPERLGTVVQGAAVDRLAP